MKNNYRLTIENTYKECPEIFLTTTSETSYIMQNEAIENLLMGLSIDKFGYNIYVIGDSGVNKKHLIQAYLHNIAKDKPTPSDLVYLHNFNNPDSPLAVNIKPGHATILKQFITDLNIDVEIILSSIFSSNEYDKEINRINTAINKENIALLDELNQKAKKLNIRITKTQEGFSIFPLDTDGKQITPDVLQSLSTKEQESLIQKTQNIKDSVTDIISKTPLLEKKKQDTIRIYNEELIKKNIQPLTSKIRRKFSYSQPIKTYLAQLKIYLSQLYNSSHQLLKSETIKDTASSDILFSNNKENPLDVNILVSNTHPRKKKGAPIVYEDNPTYANLFGKIEYSSHLGMLSTNFMNIKPGSLHKANGGFLIINAHKLLAVPLLWENLKRTITNRCVEINNTDNNFMQQSPLTTLSPEKIPLDVKIILIGSKNVYYFLWQQDEEFKFLFKMVSEFTNTIPYNKENILQYVGYIKYYIKKHNFKPLTNEALTFLIELLSFFSDSQTTLSTNTHRLKTIIIEANYFASAKNISTIDEAIIKETYYAQRNRLFKYSEYIERNVGNKTLLIETKGTALGQINGLSIFALNDLLFGQVQRITCVVYKGKQGLVNIEESANLSGALHNKGIMIVQAFINARFGQIYPVSFAANIAFEQSYGYIDGDSATSTELYALLSALSGIPINQSIACTGSMDQHGNVQAIGGVNHKIQGFFEICNIQGLTGKQGVLIPKSNVKDLILPTDIREAISKKKFHIYAIEHIDQGIEILTNIPAGVKNKNENYPLDTINYIIQKKWHTKRIK